MNAADIIIISVIAISTVFAVIYLIRRKKKGVSCCCGDCSKCSGCK